MGWEAWFVVAVVSAKLAVLALEWAPADLVCMMALFAVVAVAEVQRYRESAQLDVRIAEGEVAAPATPQEREKLISKYVKLPTAGSAIREFGNTGLITVGLLFVVVAGLVQTGAMSILTGPLLGRPKNLLTAQVRLLTPVAAASGFLNNTPIVAMFMPIVGDVCKRTGISPSKLFLPMAYAATLGGVCTVIGTSTNIIVNDKLPEDQKLALFELSWVGLPCAVGGLLYLIGCSGWLLPDRKPALSLSDDPRQYTTEMIVEAGGPLVGRSVEKAGLRHLPGLFLVEIERGNEVLPAVSSKEKLQANDRLVFVGIVESVVDLRKMRGLLPATDQVFKIDTPDTDRTLIEAVVSERCPLVGMSIREGRFRTHYNAAVLGVARGGKRIPGKIGDIVLQAGDTLLVEAHTAFVQQQRNSSDFFLVSHVENSAPVRHNKSWIALTTLAGMVAFASLGDGEYMLPASMGAAVLMIVTRCCTAAEGRQSIDLSVLITIGASLALGRAIEMSGAARASSESMIGLAGDSAWVQLGLVYLLTLVLTELVTNNTAAVLMLPLALATVERLGVNHKPFVVAVMIAASCGFATPFGYQTNLMVYGPGGYRFSDYLRIGIPLDVLMMIITVALAPFAFPF
ncbi:MAG: SLC13 family permease [Planctomycetaceae bacterium]|nr:SLC13 family permease [Planctomycetaceae bacterium]